ncbi:MAG TPA: outer membrane beta-barrel protein [Microvirga sp.]|nr:outer membrane beta-barrel protein [Microvirga sp.]
MNAIKSAVLTGLFTATATAAVAADLPRAFLPSAPVFRDSRTSSGGWYLRGEIGYSYHKRPEADFAAAPFSGGFVHEGLGSSAVGGVGVGYRLNPNVRMDVTADYFNAHFKGTAPTPTFATTSIEDRGLFQSTAFLVNGYLDFGGANGFTPYVGAGIGVAHNVLSDYTRTTYNVATGTETWERLAGGNEYSLAWAVMAGVGYRLSSNFTVDLGYRYIGRGDLKTRNYAAGAGTEVESLGAHEVRLGVRYGL